MRSGRHPDRRADEVHGGNAGLLELRFQGEVEIRRIDTDEDTRPFLQEMARNARADPKQFGQVAQHLDVAVDRQLFAR
jgi:hypothetical protein